MIDLKPCPFCGGDAEFTDCMLGEFYANCTDCQSMGATCATEEDAAAAWNTRPESLTLTAAVQGEREAIKAIVRGFIGTNDRSSQAVAILSMLDARTSPAVDVLPDALREKVREFIAKLDETHEARLTKRLFEMVEELRSLVAASPKAERPAHKGESDEQS